ncbi:hypothetical protein D3C74_282610 [compost metagenome]
MLHGSYHFFVFVCKIEGIASLIASLLKVGIGGQNFSIQRDNKSLLKNRLMCYNPADPVFNGSKFAVISTDQSRYIRRIYKASRNIGATHQLDPSSFIHLMVSGTISEVSNGGAYEKQYDEHHPS